MSGLRDRTQSDLARIIDDLLPRLEDLHRQATEDRSHYYTGALIAAAMETLIQARYWLGPQPRADGRKSR